MTARRLALGVLLTLSFVAGAQAQNEEPSGPWTYAPIDCGGGDAGLACCTDPDVECCEWSGDNDGASIMR